MVPSLAALVVALALGEVSGGARVEARAAIATTNAARAKLGLLPRKAPARTGAARRAGRQITPVAVPTFLGEPGTLADAAGNVPLSPPPPELRLSAGGVVADVTVSLRYDR